MQCQIENVSEIKLSEYASCYAFLYVFYRKEIISFLVKNIDLNIWV